MRNEMDFDKLAELCLQVERAWFDNHDRTVVEDLGEKYPEFREELSDFFAELVLDPAAPSDEMARAEDRLSQWLTSSGFEIAKKTAELSRSVVQTTSTPFGTERSDEIGVGGLTQTQKLDSKQETNGRSWVFVLKTRTNQNLQRMAGRLTNVTVEYLVLVSRHPSVVPWEAKRRIAEEVERVWGVPAQDSFACLAEDPQFLRAASRSKPFGDNPATFHELLDRAALTEEQKRFWLAEAKSRR
jgi:hypothetical protein